MSSMIWEIPLLKTSSDLFAIDTKIIMSDEVIQNIKKAEDTGKEQCRTFVDECMIKMDKDGYWTPLWTILPEASKGCRELVKCICRKRCLGRCQCHKANSKCTQLYFCGEQCTVEKDD